MPSRDRWIVNFMTPSAPYEKSKSLGSGGSMVARLKLKGIPSKRKSSACVDYVPALCTHRPSLLPIEQFSEIFGLARRRWQQQ